MVGTTGVPYGRVHAQPRESKPSALTNAGIEDDNIVLAGGPCSGVTLTIQDDSKPKLSV